MKRFAFRAAADLYKSRRHPRLLFGPTDLPKLRRQCRTGDGKIILDGLRPEIQTMIDLASGAGNLTEALSKRDARTTDYREHAFMVGLLGELDQSPALIELAKKILIASAADNHVDPMGYDLLQPYLTVAERRLVAGVMVKDIRDRLAESERYYYAGAAHNLTINRTFGAIWSLLAILGEPGVPAMKDEIAEVLRRYEATLYTSVHDDGYPEEDIGYGTSVYGSTLLMGEGLRRAGFFDPYTAYPGVKKFGQAMLHFVQPWGEAVTNTGDHGSTFYLREFSLPRVAAETKDPTVLWLASTLEDAYLNFSPDPKDPKIPRRSVRIRNGTFIVQLSIFALLTLDDIKEPLHPAKAKPAIPTEYIDPQRGILTFRNSWKDDATFITFDAAHRSPAGPGHWHASAGHFNISALGEMFAIDTGRYNMEQDQHSVVIVNGKSGRSTEGEWTSVRHHGQLLDYAPDKFCDVAAADNSMLSDCYWSRRWIGLVKGDAPYVWTVDDVNKKDDWNEFWWQLQTSPENIITTREDGATITGWKHGNKLDVKLFVPPPTEFPKPHTLSFAQDIKSTSSYKYVPNAAEQAAEFVHPARLAHGPCFVRPRLLGKIAGYNGRIMSVMTPYEKGGPTPRVRKLESVPSSFAAQIDIGRYRDTVIFSFEHDLLEADDVIARGKWVVVRRDKKSGRVLAHTLGHGRSLSVGGKKIV